MAFGLFRAAEARTFRAARLVAGSAHTDRSTDIPRLTPRRCSGIVKRNPVKIFPTRSWRRGGEGRRSKKVTSEANARRVESSRVEWGKRGMRDTFVFRKARDNTLWDHERDGERDKGGAGKRQGGMSGGRGGRRSSEVTRRFPTLWKSSCSESACAPPPPHRHETGINSLSSDQPKTSIPSNHPTTAVARHTIL